MEKLLNFLKITNNLNTVFRYSEYSELKNTQSTASHSWRLAFLVILTSKEYDIKIDTEKALKLAIIHDLAESITGDVDNSKIYTNKVSKKDKEENEIKAIKQLKNLLQSNLGEDIESIWMDYEQKNTIEAKFVYALDKIEALIYISETARNELHYPEMIVKYADKAVTNFPELKPLLKIVKSRLKILFDKNGIEWKEEYDEV